MITKAFALNRTRLTFHRNLPRQGLPCRGFSCSTLGEQATAQLLDRHQGAFVEIGIRHGFFEATVADEQWQHIGFAQALGKEVQQSCLAQRLQK